MAITEAMLVSRDNMLQCGKFGSPPSFLPKHHWPPRINVFLILLFLHRSKHTLLPKQSHAKRPGQKDIESMQAEGQNRLYYLQVSVSLRPGTSSLKLNDQNRALKSNPTYSTLQDQPN